MQKLTNISEAQKNALGVQALADRPNANLQYGVAGLSAKQLKEWFDKLAFFLVTKINELQNTLSDTDAADYIRITLYDIVDKETDAVITPGSLKDLIKSLDDGTFADKLYAKPYGSSTTATLNAALQSINKNMWGFAKRLKLKQAGDRNHVYYLTLIDADGDVLTSVELDFNIKESNQIAEGIVNSGHISDSAVTTEKIADSAVTAGKIAGGAVTEDKIYGKAVTTEKIGDLAVTSAKLAPSAVTIGKIQNGAVIANTIQNNAVITSKIASEAVTTEKIADSAVTSNKLDKTIRDNINSAFTNVSYDPSSGVLTLKTSEGNETSIDLPLELIVTSGNYDNTPDDEAIVLILANGSNIRIPLTDISEKLADNIADVKDIIDTVNKKTTKLEYKKLFTQYGSDDGENGYIAVTMPANSVIEIDIEEDYNAEHSHFYLQLACGHEAHTHEVLINSSKKKVYAYGEQFSDCTWYIPWYLDLNGVGVSVSARCVSNTSIDYVSGEWVSGTPIEAEWWTEVSEHYATKEDIGDISSALTKLHNYAQTLINGGDA